MIFKTELFNLLQCIVSGSQKTLYPDGLSKTKLKKNWLS